MQFVIIDGIVAFSRSIAICTDDLPNGIEDGKEARLESVFEHLRLCFLILDLFKNYI